MSDVVTGQFKKKTPWGMVGITVAIVLVAGGAGVGLRWWQMHHTAQPVANRTTPKTPANVSEDQALQGDYAAAQKTIEQALQNKNLSAEHKYQLYYQQGVNAQNHGDMQAALASFKLAITFKKTQSLYESMGKVAAALGDNTSAIQYYKQAIQLIPSGSPIAGDLKQSDERIIQSLGGQP